jgi:hypothetical protein
MGWRFGWLVLSLRNRTLEGKGRELCMEGVIRVRNCNAELLLPLIFFLQVASVLANDSAFRPWTGHHEIVI